MQVFNESVAFYFDTLFKGCYENRLSISDSEIDP